MTETKKIVFLGRQAGYLEARKLAAERGMKLASNVLHDDYLVKTNNWRAAWAEVFVQPWLYSAWAREVLVHPAKDKWFVNGNDVVDSDTGWCLPWEYLKPKHIKFDLFEGRMFSHNGFGLVVDPKDVIEERGRIVVIPSSIVLLDFFLQKDGSYGQVDEATRVPRNWGCRTEQEKRQLSRTDGIGVRPLARLCNMDGGFRQTISGNYLPDDPLEVAIEAPEAGAPETSLLKRLTKALRSAFGNEKPAAAPPTVRDG